MTAGLSMMLLVFSGVAFAGAGAALGILRFRHLESGESDAGLVSVIAMLVVFGSLCALLGAGFGAVLGFGGVVLWVSYVLTAQRVGLFRIEAGRRTYPEEHPGEIWRI